MARSLLNKTTTDVTSPEKSILLSLVQGEQLELAVSLQFLPEGFSGYIFKAVVIEADNVSGQSFLPTASKTGGVSHTLSVRVPVFRGTWSNAVTYNLEDSVKYLGVTYKLQGISTHISGLTPNLDPYWVVTAINCVYVQFNSSIGLAWSPNPSPTSSTYGFFELRILAPTGDPLRKTWKPLRGVIELLYSLTSTNSPSFTVYFGTLVDISGSDDSTVVFLS